MHGGTLRQEGTGEVVYKGAKQPPRAKKGRDQTFPACARIIATDGGTVLASSSGGPPSQVTYYEMEASEHLGAGGPDAITVQNTLNTESNTLHCAARLAVTSVILLSRTE